MPSLHFCLLKLIVGFALSAASQDQQQSEDRNELAVFLTPENLRNGSLCCRFSESSSAGRSVNCSSCGLTAVPLLHPDIRPDAVLLAGNRIRRLGPGAFVNASGLRFLNLSGNPQLARLPAGCLATAADSLVELDISGTGLSDSTCEGLDGLRRLQRLRMAGLRQLDSLPTQLAKLTTLQDLDASDGGLAVVRAGDFRPGATLESLRLTQTQLYRIEAAAFQNLGSSLRRLEISAPTLGRTLVVEGGTEYRGAWDLVLRRLANLSELQLSSHPPVLNCSADDEGVVKGLSASTFWPAVLPLRSLQRLVLDGNCLSRAPHSLGRELLPGLLELSLADNPFVCACPSSPQHAPLQPDGVSGVTCATLEAALLGTVDRCPTLRQQATVLPVLQSEGQPQAQPHAGLVIASCIVTSLTFLAAVAIVAVFFYYRRISLASSSAASVAATSEIAKIEVYAEYERPIAAGVYSGSGAGAYEELAEPTLPLPTRTTRRFFRRSERPSTAVDGFRPEPPPLPPRSQPPPQPPPRPKDPGAAAARASSGAHENSAYSPADEKGDAEALMVVSSF